MRLHSIDARYARDFTVFIRSADAKPGAALARFAEVCRTGRRVGIPTRASARRE